MDLTTIELSGGHKQLVPSTLILLNPQREGNAHHLYFVWVVDAQNPCALDDAIEGRALGFYGFFSDLDNFDSVGRHDPLLTTQKGWASAVSEYETLLHSVLDRIDGTDSPSGEWAFFWCLCDCLGGEVGVGSSPVFTKVVGANE